MLKKGLVLSFCLFFFFYASVIKVSADIELTVEGNGEQSDNEVNLNVSNNATVTQSNSADISSQVNTDANTGNNNASSNTGDANINTGSVDVSTTINNTDINQNTADSCCKATDVNAQITGNGDNSINQIDTNITSNRSLTQTNIVVMDNNEITRANTGENNANKNNGDVSIITGDITVKNNTNNKNINNSKGSPGGGVGDVNLKVNGNGADSKNNINLNIQDNLDIFIFNETVISNFNFNDLNTGRNNANENNGDVSINTGDITLINNITNEDINISFLKVSPCEKCEKDKPEGENPPVGGNGGEKPKETPPNDRVLPPPATTNPQPSQGESKGGDVIAKAGDVLGAATKAILPATGGYWLFLLTMANIMLFFLGWYLRLRSGNSPGVLYA